MSVVRYIAKLINYYFVGNFVSGVDYSHISIEWEGLNYKLTGHGIESIWQLLVVFQRNTQLIEAGIYTIITTIIFVVVITFTYKLIKSIIQDETVVEEA